MTFRQRTREDWQRFEHQWLAPYACRSDTANGTRRFPEPEHPYRTAFQRDRDRLVHSRAFRRLKHKRQVFLITEGDHFRTRMTHTLEVAQISRTMARALGLNEDLVEAIALGHDLGHTPFGHLGEYLLDDILQGKDTLEGAIDAQPRGGFKHNYQSLRIVDVIEQKYELPGLNLTAAVREGILKHTRLKRGQIDYPAFDKSGLFFENDMASTLEGQVVAIADEVAQRTHDFEDGLRAELVSLEEIQELLIVREVTQRYGLADSLVSDRTLYRNRLVNGLINFLVSDVIDQTLRNVESFCTRKSREAHFDEETVCFSSAIDALQSELNKFIYQRIIFNPGTRRPDDQAKPLLRILFRTYMLDTHLIPATASLFAGSTASEDAELPRRIADFIGGMTDSFAIAEYERLRALDATLPLLDLEALGLRQSRLGRKESARD